jgi:hypothetical protein
VPANTPQSVRVNFAIPAGATLGTYQGTIHLRTGTQTLPQTLKVAVDVWQPFFDSALGFSLKYPPSAVIVRNSETTISIQTAQEFNQTGASHNDLGPPTTEGFQITIEKRPPVSGSFDVQQWLHDTYPLWQPSAIQSALVHGNMGYLIPADAEPEGFTTVIIPTTSGVYVITYVIAYFNSIANAAGLNTVQLILGSLTFQ